MIRKTPMDKRESYTYEYESVDKNGNRVVVKEVLRPKREGNEKDQEDEKRVPPEFIKELHGWDDKEVYNNCKNGHPPLTPAQEMEKKIWEKEHPGEKYPVLWNYSTDYLKSESENNDISKSRILSSAAYDPFDEETSYAKEKLWDIIDNRLSPQQRTVIKLIYIEEYKGTEVADIMGITAGRVSQLHKKAIECLRKNF